MLDSKITSLVLRIFTSVLLIISFFILVTMNITIDGDYSPVKYSFINVYGYRYMLAATVIGFVFNLLQIAFSIYAVVSKGDGPILFFFYGDKFLSYLIISGSVAGFAVTVELKASLGLDAGGFLDSYFSKALGSSTLLLFAFICTAIVSILSSFALSKRASA